MNKPFGLALHSAAGDDQGTDGVRALKHTPGPWEYRKVDYILDNRDTFEVSDGGVTPYWVAQTLTEENARLIAAAPDLLEALRKFMLCTQVGTKKEQDAWFEKGRQAICKARGEFTVPRSANAGQSQPTNDRTEERQQQGESK